MDELYVADAHAFACYLADKLPKKSDDIFKKAELEKYRISIPSIAVAELIHVFERAGAKDKIWEFFEKIDSYPSFSICPLDEELLKIVPDVELTELHDRIIIAACKSLKAEALITKDRAIKESGLVKTIW